MGAVAAVWYYMAKTAGVVVNDFREVFMAVLAVHLSSLDFRVTDITSTGVAEEYVAYMNARLANTVYKLVVALPYEVEHLAPPGETSRVAVSWGGGTNTRPFGRLSRGGGWVQEGRTVI